MKILVTGGTGFIGRTLAPHLLAAGHEVALLVREAYGMGEPLPAPLHHHRHDLQLLYADLRNFRQTSAAVQAAAPTAVIHLAAAGATHPFLPIRTALRHNLDGTLHLLQACFERNRTVEKMVVARTPGEKVAMNMYAASKLAAWNVCQMYARTHRWPVVGGMIYQAYGWGQAANTLVPSAFCAAVKGDDFPMTAGAQLRDWIDVDDVAAGLIALVNATVPAGTTLELGTGKMSSLAEVVQLIYRVVGMGGRPLLGALPTRPGEVTEQKAAADDCAAAIGFRAAISLAAGLKKYKEQLVS